MPLAKLVLAPFLLALAPSADDEPLYSLSVMQNVLSGNGKEAFGHCGLCFLKRNGRPFACYALHKKGGDDSRFAFLLLFSPAGKGPVLTDSSRADERGMMLKGKLTLGEESVEVAYRAKFDDAHNLVEDALSLGGRELKRDDPRIILVDFSGGKPVLTPVKAELPNTAPHLTDDELPMLGKAVEKTVRLLKARSPEVKAFLEKAGQ